MKRYMVSFVCLVMAAALVFIVAGCNREATKEAMPNNTEETQEATPEPTFEPRNGGMLDEINFAVIADDEAISQIKAGDIDIFAEAMPGEESLKSIENAGLDYSISRGMYYEIMLNPADTAKTAGELNPFAIKEIREAMNWLIDRDYICQEIFGGTAMPKYVPQIKGSPEYERYIEYIRQVEAEYAYNKEKAVTVIERYMIDAGAVKDSDGIWNYKEKAVVITALIRSDDSLRNRIGDHVCNELESIGFTVNRLYKSQAECFSFWEGTDPAENEWNLYTGAWEASGNSRDEGNWFKLYYSPDSEYNLYKVWREYTIDSEFNEVCEYLAKHNFVSKEDREALFAEALQTCNDYSYRIWLCDSLSYTPRNSDVLTSSSFSQGVNNELTPFTIRFNDTIGGSLIWANSSMFAGALNPVGGSNEVEDSQYKNFTQDYGVIPDPFTGLYLKQRIDSAEVVMQTGLPVTKTYDWVSLSFQDEIAVPADSMINWDSVTQTWESADQDYLNSLVADAAAQLATVDADKNATDDEIESAQAALSEAEAVAEKGYLTAKRKSVVTYPSDIYNMTWHDGTSLSAADFMMRMIVAFDLGSEGSPYYDPALADDLVKFKDGFKGFKILSTDPLKIEYYSDLYWTDAEFNVETLWPDYGSGQSNWADMALSLKAVASGSANFTRETTQSSPDGIWLDWLAGPSMQVLEDSLEQCISESYIPYEPTMGQYITVEQADAAYDNILNFYSEYGHFYIGCGPYFISYVDKSAMTLTLNKYNKYIDDAQKWSDYKLAKFASVSLNGPENIAPGQLAVFDINVAYDQDNTAYPPGQIQSVKTVLSGANGQIAFSGEAQFIQDGLYRMELTPDITSELESGACRLEVYVLTNTVAVNATSVMELTVQ